MAEYVGIVYAGIVEGAHDSFAEGITGREATSAETSVINFAPGAVGEPGGATPITVVEGTHDGFAEGITGREPTGEIVIVLETVHDGFAEGITGREIIAEIIDMLYGYPESVFGKRTSGYVVDASGNYINPLDGAVVTLVSDTTGGEYEKATKVAADSFYEVFLEGGGYDEWYLVVKKGSKHVIYKKESTAPVIDGDNLPDTVNLVLVKIRFKGSSMGRTTGGLS